MVRNMTLGINILARGSFYIYFYSCFLKLI